MGKQYRVTAEYVTMKTLDQAGNRVLLGYYRGAVLPDELDEESVEHHLSTGQIEEVDADNAADMADFVPEGTPEGGQPEVRDGLGEPNRMAALEPEGEPRRGDSREDWVEYAVSKGGDREDIEAKKVSKADLIAVWGTPRK